MLNSLLADAKTREIPVSEAAFYALLGYAIVFAGIVFLILVVWLVGKVMSTRKASPVKTKVEPMKETVTESLAVADASEEISEETVAVITAAIMAYYQQTKPKCEFTVKRIKRI